jgi:ankyrin repeat protein
MTTAEQLFGLLNDGNIKAFREAADQSPITRVACDRHGDFLLHRAVTTGSLAACKYLLGRGIPATCPGSRGATPLHEAACKGNATIMTTLLRAAGPQHSPINANGMTPLHVAAGAGRLAIVKRLIKRGADSCVQDKFGRLPVHFAAGSDQLPVVWYLAAREPKLIDVPDAFGQRPIHWALQYECVRTAIWLIRSGVDMKAPDIYDRSPLRVGGLPDDAEAIALHGDARLRMVLRGTQVRRLTPLERAIFCEDLKQIRKHLRNPADLNRRGDLGRTALHMAAFARNRDIYRWMQKKGADPKAVDDYGWMPFTLLSYRLITDPLRLPRVASGAAVSSIASTPFQDAARNTPEGESR